MGATGRTSGIVAILNWRAAAQLKENVRFLERRATAGSVHPRDWRIGGGKYRSLTVRGDGTCLLQRLSVSALGRRHGGLKRVRKTRETRETA